VAAAINRDLGGIEMLMSDFNAAGGRLFGSGWVFVTLREAASSRSERGSTRTVR